MDYLQLRTEFMIVALALTIYHVAFSKLSDVEVMFSSSPGGAYWIVEQGLDGKCSRSLYRRISVHGVVDHMYCLVSRRLSFLT